MRNILAIVSVFLAGFSLAFVNYYSPPSQGCGIPGQYMNAAGECVCPAGTYHDRGTVACEQETCPSNAGRTYTMECLCDGGLVPISEEHVTETGHVYYLVASCVEPGFDDPSITNPVSTTGITNILLPTPQRFSDAWDAMTHSGGLDILERGAGFVSLVGAAASTGLILYGGGLVASRAGAWILGRGAPRAVLEAGRNLFTRATTAELGAIETITAPQLRTLVQAMKQAGMTVNRKTLLAVINEARALQGLHPWGMSNLAIILKGIGL